MKTNPKTFSLQREIGRILDSCCICTVVFAREGESVIPLLGTFNLYMCGAVRIHFIVTRSEASILSVLLW